MTRSRRLLCAFYAFVALVALLGTWSQNVAYFGSPGDMAHAFGRFLGDLKANPATRSISIDISLFLLAGSVLMIVEARRVGARFVGAYILGGLLIAISVTFPLFLIAREMRLASGGARSETEKSLTVSDIAGIVLLTLIAGALVRYLYMP
jgi:hypothetical protein